MKTENKDASSLIENAVKSGQMARMLMRIDSHYENPSSGFGGARDPSNKLIFNQRRNQK